MRKAWLLALVLLGGCMNNHPAVRPLHPLEIPTAPYQPVAVTALRGSLMYEGGCLLFRDEQTGTLLLPVWPAGSSFNGTGLLYHLPGKSDQWVVMTQEALLDGQPLSWQALASPAYDAFHHQCGAYAPFFVTAVRPAN
jgi:hypothetical protein